MSISVHQVAPAPALTAGWVRALLEPAAKAAGISNPPPLEIRPCGAWGGFSHHHSTNPDGRVCVSSRVILWSKSRCAALYIHEVSHRLLADAGAPDADHDPRFFSLQFFMLMRLDLAGFMQSERITPWIHGADLYDISTPPIVRSDDQPFELSRWLGASLDWSVELATRMINEGLTAEEAAARVVVEFPKFAHELIGEPQKSAEAAAVLTSLRAQVRHEKSLNSNWRKVNLQTMFAGAVGWILLGLVLTPWH